jgi:hypothetical protein
MEISSINSQALDEREDFLKEDNSQLKNFLSDFKNSFSTKDYPSWIAIVLKIPQDLREILVFEIEQGNYVRQISVGNWPNSGSTFISLMQPFKTDLKSLKNGITYRKIQDVHYWYEEIVKRVEDVEHLIVTDFPEDYLKTNKKPRRRH